MDQTSHNKIVSFIWSIADDCLRDVFVRGKYRDVILPMFVLRRLDCLLEPSKDDVLKEVNFQLNEAKLTEMDQEGLTAASGYVFYNTSQFTLKSLLGNPSQLQANFETYLNGFSANVQEIIDNFDLRNQARKMVNADILHDVIEKFVSDEINLSPNDARGPDGRLLPGLSNLGMGYVFEELIRKFNEENNEEAGEHFTPREVIKLMTHLLFDPVKDKLPPVITIYDPACGSGGMLTESQNFITDPEGGIKSTAQVFVYGKEVNPETYAICKSDMMIKGNNPENIKLGSTLATNEFSKMKFDFMLSNPPYGKSWSTEVKFIKDGKDIIDPRFQLKLTDFFGETKEVGSVPRSSDGQLLFLMEMVDKLRDLSVSPAGSRIASVHNGSSLFTGDAGGGESNIRRYILENDLLEAIIQLPNNLFYNTGITTYIWVLSNAKPDHRKGKVQLINASEMYTKRRKNLGEKNCDLTDDHIAEITRLYLEMADEGVSKVFNNSDFGYHKVTIERPLRKSAKFSAEGIATLRFHPAIAAEMAYAYGKYGDDLYTNLKAHTSAINDWLEREEITISPKNKKLLFAQATWTDQKALMETAERVMERVGTETFTNFNRFEDAVDDALKAIGVKLAAPEKKQILNAVSWTDDAADPVVKKISKITGDKLEKVLDANRTTQDHLSDYGYWPAGKSDTYIEYETDSELRDTEVVPLDEDIHAYFLREVRPHVADAWIDLSKTQVGCEISFNRYFYQHQALRSLDDVAKEIMDLDSETDGLLRNLIASTGGVDA